MAHAHVASIFPKMKHKILYLNYHSEIGGGETALLTLLTNLNRRLFTPYLVTTREGSLSRFAANYSLHTTIIPLPGYLWQTFFLPGFSFQAFNRLLHLTNIIKPHLIHTNHLNLILYAGILGKLKNIPVIASAHGPWDSIYFFQDLLSNLLTDKILTNTAQTARKLLRRKIITANKIIIMNFGIDTQRFKPRDKTAAKKHLQLPLNSLILSTVGRLDPVKDLLTFLKAADTINKKQKNVSFLIAGSARGDFSKSGDKYRESLNIFLKSKPDLATKIINLGFVDKVEEVYQASDVVVSSSLSESFGLTLAEASSCQIPVVTTNQGSQNLIIKDGETGYLVPPHEPQILADKVLHLLKNRQLRQQFGQQGRKHITTTFNLTKYIKRVESIYINTLNQ